MTLFRREFSKGIAGSEGVIGKSGECGRFGDLHEITDSSLFLACSLDDSVHRPFSFVREIWFDGIVFVDAPCF